MQPWENGSDKLRCMPGRGAPDIHQHRVPIHMLLPRLHSTAVPCLPELKAKKKTLLYSRPFPELLSRVTTIAWSPTWCGGVSGSARFSASCVGLSMTSRSMRSIPDWRKALSVARWLPRKPPLLAPGARCKVVVVVCMCVCVCVCVCV